MFLLKITQRSQNLHTNHLLKSPKKTITPSNLIIYPSERVIAPFLRDFYPFRRGYFTPFEGVITPCIRVYNAFRTGFYPLDNGFFTCSERDFNRKTSLSAHFYYAGGSSDSVETGLPGNFLSQILSCLVFNTWLFYKSNSY